MRKEFVIEGSKDGCFGKFICSEKLGILDEEELRLCNLVGHHSAISLYRIQVLFFFSLLMCTHTCRNFQS
mgnify:CR=1 FL=1